MEGYGFFAKNLEYGQSKAVGPELGFVMTTKDMAEKKRPVVERIVWAYPQDPGGVRGLATEDSPRPMPS